MGNPYTSQSIANYNSSPPPDDGSNTSANEITWAKHKTKLADPLKTLAEGIDSAVSTAFGKVFGANITSTGTSYTVLSSDQGKLIRVTGSATITTPTAASEGAPFVFAVKNEHSAAITIEGAGSENVDGSANISLPPGQAIVLTTDGSDWYSMAGYVETGADAGKIALNDQALTTVASAATVDLTAVSSENVNISGTDTITSFGTGGAGLRRLVRATGAFTMQHGTGDGNPFLPNGADITAAVNDVFEFVKQTTGPWLLANYKLQSGNALATADVQTFTSGGTWTKPSGATRVYVQAWGAGGSGGTASGGHGGGGGGGGGYTTGWFAASALGATETVTIGSGGASVSAGDTPGNAGGNSTFGSHLTAYGGAGGLAGSASSDGAGGGGGGSFGAASGATGGAPTTLGGFGGGDGGAASGANGDDSFYGGGGGGSGAASTGQAGGDSYWGAGGGGGGVGTGAGGAGGTSIMGGDGGAGVTGASNGVAGTQPGGGGGGVEAGGNTGAGADGQIIVISW